MATGDIVSLGDLVLRIAGQVQVLGENCYRASKDWEAFPDKVQNLRLLYHVWKDEFEKFGMLSDPILMMPLEQAKVLLEKEEDKLKSRGAGCGSILCMTAFPGTIGQRVQRVIDAFDNIPKMLQLKDEARAALEKAWQQMPRPLAFRDDDRYVSLKDSESAVYSALAEKPVHGPKVVLLHGGPGKGKSTLARHVAVLYENLRKQAKGEDNRVQFQQVIYLECGQKATALLKQVELLQWLGMEDAALQDDQQTDLDRRISMKLRNALSSQNILIIFDDVWERRFLKQMLDLCGDGVKCLVTSQHRSLCWGLQYSPSVIRIQDVTPEVGRKMLASYVFPKANQQLPRQVLGLADEIVQKCEGNPLALASVSTALRNDPDEPTEWANAKLTLFTLLESEDIPEILSKKYPRSFLSAIQLSLKALEEDGLNLLVLVHLCTAPSVPEEVVHFLYQSIKGVPRTFQVLRNELEDRELIKITSPSLSTENHGKEKSWSVHSLQRQFMTGDAGMRKLQNDILASILVGALSSTVNTESKKEPAIVAQFSTDEDAMVRIVVCSLYFDRGFGLQASSKLGVNQDRFEEMFNDLRRNAIEPVIRLLVQPLSELWTASLQALTKKVILEYVFNDQLHNEGTSNLLTSKMSTLPMLDCLDRVATIKKEPLLTKGTGGIMKTLVGLLRNWEQRESFENTVTAMTLRSLSFNPEHKGYIISSGCLEAVVNILSADSPANLQVALTRMLVALSYWEHRHASWDDLQLRMSRTQGLFDLLSNFLSKEAIPVLQEKAALTLVNLAALHLAEVKTAFLNSGAVQRLRKLCEHDGRKLKKFAASALSNHTGSTDLFELCESWTLHMRQKHLRSAEENLTHANQSAKVLGENRYRASKDWEAFPDSVQNLRLLYHVWKDEFEKFGMLSDPILMTPLEEAKVLLEKEEARIKSRGAGCGSIFCLTAFPGTIGQRVQRVIDAFDNIPKTLQLKEEARDALEKTWLRRPRPLAFRDDDRYVSLKDSESAVYSALAEKHLHGPKVVLLHGGPGKDKSTLARHVAVLCENLRKQAKGEDNRVQFQQVIYLECGQKATVLLKQVELLQWLGMEDAVLQDDQQTDVDRRISVNLRIALSSQNILIIFDDVWERRFLKQMLDLCGVGVKRLVTSQNRSLCWGLQCSPSVIRIQDVTPEVGRKMLASYVFPKGNQQLPRQVLVLGCIPADSSVLSPHLTAVLLMSWCTKSLGS